MKIIGKQIVVELPENKQWETTNSLMQSNFNDGYNLALSEVARMNPAIEMDVDELRQILACSYCTEENKYKVLDPTLIETMIKSLASDPSRWLKRKDSDDKEKS